MATVTYLHMCEWLFSKEFRETHQAAPTDAYHLWHDEVPWDEGLDTQEMGWWWELEGEENDLLTDVLIHHDLSKASWI